ncbi:hypothetical protein L6Q96_23230, partial [Candidatus Binatia bacterium]|nr:hypothetical protein [Candidatus Binatia bacterium]
MTVTENLELGGWLVGTPAPPRRGDGLPRGFRQLAKPDWLSAKAERARRIDEAFTHFPKLRERANQLA